MVQPFALDDLGAEPFIICHYELYGFVIDTDVIRQVEVIQFLCIFAIIRKIIVLGEILKEIGLAIRKLNSKSIEVSMGALSEFL